MLISRARWRLPNAVAGRLAASQTLMIAGVAAGGFWLGILRHTTNGNLGLVAREESLDFGEVWEQAKFAWTVEIENPTSETVSIESFDTSCGCTAPEPSQMTIGPGSSSQVRLVMDFSPRKPGDAASPVSDFAVRLTPTFRRGETKLQGKGWLVRGRVHRALNPSRRAIVFGQTSQLVEGGPLETQTITAEAMEPLRGVEAMCEPPILSAAVIGDESPGTYRIAVTPSRGMRHGIFRATLLLQPITTAGERLPAVPIKIEGEMFAPVVAIPDAIDFGRQSLGGEAQVTIRLESPLRQPFGIDRLETRAEGEAQLTADRAEPPNRLIRLTGRFTRAGRFAAEARVWVRAANAEPFEIVLPVRGYVVEQVPTEPSS
ncbi:MAG TPA: DUF1573 domain-containing protein [Pirellulales bacterium]|nr:DUF1573 domain-containing protein [Pirellulales bacterium]